MPEEPVPDHPVPEERVPVDRSVSEEPVPGDRSVPDDRPIPAASADGGPESGGTGPVLGAVLCGGRSARFGSDKALALADGVPVGRRVVEALRDAGVDPVFAVGGTAGPAIGVPTVPDLRPGDGPLGGLATALLWAKTGPVVVVPCDLVLLGAEHVSALVAAAADNQGLVAVATIDGEPRVSLACWPAEEGRSVLKLFEGGERRYRAVLDHTRWIGVDVPRDAVADADTPGELRRLLDRRPR